MNNTPEQNILVRTKNVHKTYQKKASALHVLKGIDLEVKEGEIIAIVGPSGVGKSTLLHIVGILDRPDQGSVEIDGLDVFAFDDLKCAKIRNETVGFVFQAHHLLPEFSALENIMMPGMISGYNRQELREDALNMLAKVGLRERADHRPGELSGGEQQRVALARALINKPKLLLADEPTGNVDIHAADRLHDILWTLNRDEGQTLVLVTHNHDLAAQADRIVELFDGKIKNIIVNRK